MKVINARNVHEALPEAARYLSLFGARSDSRAGPVLVAPEPVCTVYRQPAERVVFWSCRDANPFFHLMESLWMLSGRNDVAWISEILPSMAQFSDDGATFHGAYGHRWKHWPLCDQNRWIDFDQLATCISLLAKNPQDRRVVLSMWDPARDLGEDGKDFPCNTHIYFQLNAAAGALDMTVCCRSNDMIWGAYGANAVHMSVLHEVVAASAALPLGVYRQISNNFHAYEETWNKVAPLVAVSDRVTHVTGSENPYHTGEVSAMPMVQDAGRWWQELEMFIENPLAMGFAEPFFKRVAVPMLRAHMYWRDKSDNKRRRYTHAHGHVNKIEASDWRVACTEWLERRQA